MTLTLHNIKGKKKSRKKLGRGNASGHGTYCSRGLKGQKARSGGKGGLKLRGFKQNLLNIPKMKGNKSIRPNNQTVKLSEVETTFKDGDKINPSALCKKRLIAKVDLPVKILFDKEIKSKFEISDCLVSKKVKDNIEKTGGKLLFEKKEIKKTKKTDKTKK